MLNRSFLWVWNLDTDFNIKSRYYLQMPHYQQKTHCKVWWARKLQTNDWLAPNETQHMHTFKKSMATDWPIGKKPQTSITREALEWDPQVQRKQERPFHSWKRTRLKELEMIDMTWWWNKENSSNRVRWRATVVALYSTWSEEDLVK